MKHWTLSIMLTSILIICTALLTVVLTSSTAYAGPYFGDEVMSRYSRAPSTESSKIEELGSLYVQIRKNTRGKVPHDPLTLADAILQASLKYKIQARLLSAIIMTESGYYVGAVNRRSNDYGICQINVANIKRMKLDKSRLLTDIKYSVEAGARVLAYFQGRYSHKEKYWYCRYNVGTRVLIGRLMRACQSYKRKVDRYL